MYISKIYDVTLLLSFRDSPSQFQQRVFYPGVAYRLLHRFLLVGYNGCVGFQVIIIIIIF